MRSPGIWSLLYECWDGFESTCGSDINQYKLGIFVSGHELTEYETFVSTKGGDTEWEILSTVILAPNRCLSQQRHRSSSKESLISIKLTLCDCFNDLAVGYNKSLISLPLNKHNLPIFNFSKSILSTKLNPIIRTKIVNWIGESSWICSRFGWMYVTLRFHSTTEVVLPVTETLSWYDWSLRA